MALRLPIRLSKANIITTRPAVLKNTPDQKLFLMLNDEKLTSVSTGNVPRANTSIVSPLCMKDPVVRA